MIPLYLVRDPNGMATDVIEISDNINNLVLTAGTAKSLVVPEGAGVAVFGSNCDFFLKVGGTAEAPGVDVTDGTGQEINPTARKVAEGQALSIVALGDGHVSISFFAGR